MSTTDQRIVVRRTVQAPAADVFALLSDPSRHAEIDASTMVRSSVSAPVTGVGEVFTVQMHRDGRPVPDYVTDNHIIRFTPDRRIAWATAMAGGVPSGFFWEFELHAVDALTTEVVHTYDWSAVTDEAVLARVNFPMISVEQMRGTVDRIADAFGHCS